MRLEGWHLIIIVALAVLLFGAPKLPGLARSVGQSLRIFKSEVKQMKEDGNDAADGQSSAAAQQVLDPSSGTVRPATADTIRRTNTRPAGRDATSLNDRSDARPGSMSPPQSPDRS